MSTPKQSGIPDNAVVDSEGNLVVPENRLMYMGRPATPEETLAYYDHVRGKSATVTIGDKTFPTYTPRPDPAFWSEFGKKIEAEHALIQKGLTPDLHIVPRSGVEVKKPLRIKYPWRYRAERVRFAAKRLWKKVTAWLTRIVSNRSTNR